MGKLSDYIEKSNTQGKTSTAQPTKTKNTEVPAAATPGKLSSFIENNDITPTPAANHNNAAVRERYAQKNDTLETRINRSANTLDVYGEALKMLKGEYDANPTPEKAAEFNKMLADTQQEQTDYNGMLTSYEKERRDVSVRENYGKNPEVIEGRLKAAEERIKTEQKGSDEYNRLTALIGDLKGQKNDNSIRADTPDWNRYLELSQKETLTDEEKQEAKAASELLINKAKELRGTWNNGTAEDKELADNYMAIGNLLASKTSAASSFIAGFVDSVPFVRRGLKALGELVNKNQPDGLTDDVKNLMSGANADTLGYMEQGNKTAANIGNVAGGLSTLVLGEGAVKGATSAIKGFSKLAPWVQSAINSGLTFGTISGLNTADDIQDVSQLDDVLKMAGIGLVGGAAGSVASSLVGDLGARVLTKYGLQIPFAEAVRQTLAGTAFGVTDIGVSYAMYPDDYKPDKEQIVKDVAMAFLFSALTSTLSTIETTSANKRFIESATREMQNEYTRTFSNTISPAERQAAYDHILEYNTACRAALKQNYFAGQQQYVNRIGEILDAIDEQIGMIKQTTNFSRATMLGGEVANPAQTGVVPRAALPAEAAAGGIVAPVQSAPVAIVPETTSLPIITEPSETLPATQPTNTLETVPEEIPQEIPTDKEYEQIEEPIEIAYNGLASSQEGVEAPAADTYTETYSDDEISKAAKTFGDHGSKAFYLAMDNADFDTDMPLDLFYGEFAKAYNVGKSGGELADASSDYLNEIQLYTAWAAGQNDSTSDVTAEGNYTTEQASQEKVSTPQEKNEEITHVEVPAEVSTGSAGDIVVNSSDTSTKTTLQNTENGSTMIEEKNSKISKKTAKLMAKWAANEYVNADLDKIDDPYTKAYHSFFRKFYNAGYAGKRIIDVTTDENDAQFPVFLQDVFFKAGKEDAAVIAAKEETKQGVIKEDTKNDEIQINDKGIVEPNTSVAGSGGILEGVAPEDVHATGGSGNSVQNAGRAGNERGTAAGGSDTERNGGGRSLGSGQGTDIPATGEVSEKPQSVPKAQENTSAIPEPETPEQEALADAAETVIEHTVTENPKGFNFVIGDSLNLPNGEKARFKSNVAAIKIVKQLIKEDRYATADEQLILSKYVGWGGIADAFDEKKEDWSKEFKQLKGLLTDEEYEAARKSTLNAHFTSVEVIRAMYDGLRQLGFKGGRLLEPSCGVGNFVGAMPPQMSMFVKSWTMVELDPITGSIAKYLYPNADVRIQGFEKALIPNNLMDVAISNVPFGNFGVVDKSYPSTVTGSIHNYFFAKALDKVRPGGIVMFITSRYTLDAQNSPIRTYISERADLIGAIRLPETAFKSNAGTEVVTDILVLKKREPGTPYGGEAFLDSSWGKIDSNGHSAVFNEYFKANPKMVLGTPELSGSMYGRDSLTYKPLRGNLEEQIKKAFNNISVKMEYPKRPDRETTNAEAANAAKDVKKNGMVVKDGKVYRNINGALVEQPMANGDLERVSAMLTIRDTARELLNAQLNGADESAITKLRKDLNRQYDEFVKKYGFLNDQKNERIRRDDPDSAFINALENYDKESKVGKKADIFVKNTVAKNTTITHVDSVKDGLIVSINETGGVDINRISSLVGITTEQATRQLIDSRLVFKNRNGNLETAEQYLSGNVKAKLHDAESLVLMDKDYENNIEALKQVIPADVPYQAIYVRPGATWIPPEVYSEFAAYMTGTYNSTYRKNVTIKHNPLLNQYSIDATAQAKNSVGNRDEWGTPEKTFLKLFEAVLNNGNIQVSYKGEDGKTYVNKNATIAANEKADKIKQEFTRWLWDDEYRRDTICALYNETANNMATPKYDGSNLTVDGANALKPLRPHQKDVVQRIISSGGNTLIAHEVGAGKTYEMAAAAMKLRQLGIVKKPMFVVPKSLVGQWGKEFLDFFPTAKILVASKDDTSKANRRTFANKVATGDYDAVIISYESFKAMPMSEENQRKFLQEQIDELVAAIEHEVNEGHRRDPSVKNMEKAKIALENKIAKLADMKKDIDTINFEDLGVDSVFVDEAHNFKNLFYVTHMSNVGGLGNKNGSERAFDLFQKVRWLQKINGGRGVVFATATPVMNSMSEMYIMQKYLQYDLLKQRGLESFDAWASQFGEVTNVLEIKPSGKGYRQKQSFSRFKNIPELMQLFHSFADVLTDIPGLKIPEAVRQTIVAQPSDYVVDYIDDLDGRAELISKGTVDPREDNMLKITSDGRKASYTQRMIDPSLPYEDGSKIGLCVDKVYETWEQTKKDKLTQLIFCDLATPKGSDNKKASESPEDNSDTGEAAENISIYHDIKKMLMLKGIPAKDIAFIHDADTDAKKVKLFDDVKKGNVRVLIGSTGKMGVGMNAQNKIIALHHLDSPWRPGDVKQQEGRALRQGNENDQVYIYTYVTEGTFDARMWDGLERKSKFINAVMSGQTDVREIEDIGEQALSFAEIKALASGNPLIQEQVEVSNELQRLSALKAEHAKNIQKSQAKLVELQAHIAESESRVEPISKDAKARQDISGDKFTAEIAGKTYTERAKAGKAIIEQAKHVAKTATGTDPEIIGKFAGFTLKVTAKGDLTIVGNVSYPCALNLESGTGTVQSLENIVRNLDERLANVKSSIETNKAAVAKLSELVKAPFDKQDELTRLMARNNEILMELAPPEQNANIIPDDDTDDYIYIDMGSQSVGSGETSINSNKLPAVFSKVDWVPGTINLDYGGGKFDNATEYLATLGVKSYVLDKYNRTPEHNAEVANKTENGQSDTVTISNVLNVIKEQSGRDEVLMNALDAVKPDGTVYITVYEGNGMGEGKYSQFDKTTKEPTSWQENRLTKSYVSEVEKFFGDVTVKNKVIIAKAPKKELLPDTEDHDDVQMSKGMGAPVDQWSAQRVGDVKKVPLRLSEIVDKIRHDFGIPVTTGHIRKNAEGIYSRDYQTIRTRIANSLPVVAHELGHHLDNKHGITKDLPQKLKSELVNGMDEQFKAAYKESKWKTEGLAEFVRKYLQNSESTAIDYPEFTPYFREKLGDDLSLIDELADEVNAYYSLDADTATSSIRLGYESNKDFRTPAEKIKAFGDKYYQAWVDSNHGIKLFDRETGANTYKLANNSAYADSVAYAILTGDLTDINGNKVNDGLFAALRDVNAKNDTEWLEFGEYLVVKHGPERLNEKLRVFADDRKNSTKFMNFRQAQLEAKYPKFKVTSERLYQFQKDFLRAWGVQTGLVSPESAKEWAERWEFYVPLNRAVTVKGAIGVKRGFANQRSTIHKAVGSGRDIVHPVDNIINNIVKMVNAGYRNSVMVEITNAAEKAGGTAEWLEQVPMPLKVTTYNAEGLKKNLKQAAVDNSLPKAEEDAVFGMIDSIDDILVQYGRGKAYGDVVTVLKNGSPQYWKINDPMLLSSVTNMAPQRLPAWLETYGRISRFMTSNITGNNVVWSIFSNFPRDLMTMFTFSEDKNPIHLFGGIGSAYVNRAKGAKADPMFKEYLAMGGAQMSVYTADKNMTKDIHGKLVGNKLKWLNPLEWIDFVADTVELGPRYSYYKILRNKGLNAKEAFYGSSDITVNFRRGGVYSRQVNKIIPFFNAGVQGLDKFVRWVTAEEAPKGQRAKAARGRMIAFATVSAALAALIYAINSSDDESKANYAQLSNYTKNSYWCIPLGGGKYLTIPKPREIAVLSSLFEACMERYVNKDTEALDEFYQYFADTCLPNILADVAQGDLYGAIGSLGIIGVGSYMMANRDFLGKPIVGPSMEYLEPKDQFTSRTSKLAYWIGQAFNVSPLKIDYFCQQVLGGFWKYQKALFPVGSENSDLTLGIQSQYVRDNQYSNDLINNLYDNADKALKKKNSNPNDPDLAVSYKWYDNMTTFFSRYNKLSKAEKETNESRATRQSVLNMILEFQKNMDTGAKTSSQKAVEEVCKATGSTEYMPGVMQSTITNNVSAVKDEFGEVITPSSKKSYDLNAKQYVQYQTEYLTNYWNYVEQALDENTDKTIAGVSSVIKAAKQKAADDAKAKALKRMSVISDEYTNMQGAQDAGLSASEYILFKAALDMANDDGSLTQDEVIDAIEGLNLNNEQSAYLFRTRYDSDRNNPWG